MKEKLSKEMIQLHMNGQYPVHFYESTTSTNTVAVDCANGGAEHGTVVIARHQTQGKGRLGRSFASPDDSGIYMSIVLEPISNNPVLITTAAAVAVCRAIETVAGQSAQIKWVNDIYLNNKKVCGILAEAVADHKSGAISHIILGIGVNCNAAAIPDELADIAGAVEGDFSINQLAAEIHNQLMMLANSLDPAAFIPEYKDRSLVLNQNIKVYKGGFSPDTPGTPARVLDIDESGGLVVIYTSGQRETLSTGEISIRL